jgi:hypothetical protein
MAQRFYIEYEDGTWYCSSFALPDTFVASSREALVGQIEEWWNTKRVHGETLHFDDMESADAARTLGL